MVRVMSSIVNLNCVALLRDESNQTQPEIWRLSDGHCVNPEGRCRWSSHLGLIAISPHPLNSPRSLALVSLENLVIDEDSDHCDEGEISEGQLDFFASLLGKWQICGIGVGKKEDSVKQSCLGLDNHDKQSRGDKKS